MNIGEANAVCTIIHALAGSHGRQARTPQQARDALEMLHAQAYKALSAGPSHNILVAARDHLDIVLNSLDGVSWCVERDAPWYEGDTRCADRPDSFDDCREAPLYVGAPYVEATGA